MFSVLTDFIIKHNLISNSQYGFTGGRGTVSLLEDFSDLVFESIDNNKVVTCLFLDLSKAFDTISHTVLLRKLFTYGFRGRIYQWLHNFLEERTQLVSVCGERSSVVNVGSGVPQGSVLAPLLFNIYVNDLHRMVSCCHLYQYADDTVLASVHSVHADSVELLQRDAGSVLDWFSLNEINVNQSKTQLIVFHNPLRKVHLNSSIVLHSSVCKNCHCDQLMYSNVVKYLGIFLDSDMSWNSHIWYISSKLRRVACTLYGLRSFTPPRIRRTILESLGYSVLRYGITLFGFCSETRKHKINSILKSCVKSVLYGQADFDNIEDVFVLCQLPRFENLLKYTVVLKRFWSPVFKIPNVAPRPLRKTRERFKLPFCFTRYGSFRRQYYVPFMFNSLPEDIFDCVSKSCLKRQLRELYYK